MGQQSPSPNDERRFVISHHESLISNEESLISNDECLILNNDSLVRHGCTSTSNPRGECRISWESVYVRESVQNILAKCVRESESVCAWPGGGKRVLASRSSHR